MNKFISLLLLPTILILLSPKPVKAEVDFKPEDLGTFLTLNACTQTARKAISSFPELKKRARLNRTLDQYRWEFNYSSEDYVLLICIKNKRTNRIDMVITGQNVGNDDDIDRLVDITMRLLEIKISSLIGHWTKNK